MSSRKRKALLCIHGAGTSGAIFRVQIARLSASLRQDYDFVYATAPHVTSPGPGVLPFFASMSPFYSWFSDVNEATNQRLTATYKLIQQAVHRWQSSNPESQIMGILAFSEGALVAAVLLWQQQRHMKEVAWLPDMQFAAFMRCFYREEVTLWMRDPIEGQQEGIDEEGIMKAMKIDIPTLHLPGRHDFVLQRAKMIIEMHYTPTYARVLEFNGQHAPPSRREDVEMAAKLIMELGQTKQM